ncbi:MAG: DNA replication and repair protein RecF [Bacteroidetes bacterium]|nr:DNA replication and repair protein RecF [Bacteroidota bacterium]
MFLKKIILTNFKNYREEEVSFSEVLNCFTGLNGMGKTNLLDAIFYLCMGKSHFTSSDINVLQQNESFFRLEGHFSHESKTEKIVVKVVPRKRKEMERNGTAYKKISEHIGLLPAVMIAPDDTYQLLEGSLMRRRLLNNTLSQLDKSHLHHLITYTKVLKQRNAALKHFANQNTFDIAVIESYNHQLLQPANEIFQKRKAFLLEFNPVFQEYYQLISEGKENVFCKYISKLEEEEFLTLLNAHLEKDRYSQRTNAGVHKDDLGFFINDLPLKRFASQGQRKSFILSLKLAQYEMLKRKKGTKPILLLDDIFDKLDHTRVNRLLQLLIEKNFGQVFITDTHENRVEVLAKKFAANYRTFSIQNGKVIESQ